MFMSFQTAVFGSLLSLSAPCLFPSICVCLCFCRSNLLCLHLFSFFMLLLLSFCIFVLMCLFVFLSFQNAVFAYLLYLSAPCIFPSICVCLCFCHFNLLSLNLFSLLSAPSVYLSLYLFVYLCLFVFMSIQQAVFVSLLPPSAPNLFLYFCLTVSVCVYVIITCCVWISSPSFCPLVYLCLFVFMSFQPAVLASLLPLSAPSFLRTCRSSSSSTGPIRFSGICSAAPTSSPSAGTSGSGRWSGRSSEAS